MVKRLALMLFMLTACVAPLQNANAYTTVCPNNLAKKFQYGPKMYAWVWVPPRNGDAFRRMVDDYFEGQDYFISGVEASSDETPTPSRLWDQIEQSESLDIHFLITTYSNRAFAFVRLSTFSFDCGATEDWRPHWTGFISRLQKSGFGLVLPVRAILPQTFITVSY